MKITRNNVNILIMGLVCLSILSAVPVAADQIFAPDYLWERGIASKTDPIEIADTHLGIAYRDDGTLDSQGHFTAFDRQDRFFETPGLNCSGLVVSVSRFLFDKNWTLEEVTRDRQGNSGNNAQLGKDWDFGWDLIFNLTEGKPRRIIMPEPGNYTVEGSDGITLRGFDLHDSAAWQKVLSQMKPGRMYLGSISRPAPERGYRVLHYHVVLMLPDGKGGVWLYHATRRSHVHRMNISTPQGMSRFMSQFKGSRGNAKKILIVEAILPPLAPATETASETVVASHAATCCRAGAHAGAHSEGTAWNAIGGPGYPSIAGCAPRVRALCSANAGGRPKLPIRGSGSPKCAGTSDKPFVR